MKKTHIYHKMYLLFFVLCSHVLCTTYDFYQDDFDEKKRIRLEQEEFLKKYQQFKEQLLETLKAHTDDQAVESFKVHTDDADLNEEDVDTKPPVAANTAQEKKEVCQYFLDNKHNKPFMLITRQSDENGPIQSNFIAETIAVVVQGAPVVWGWLGGLFGGGAAVTAAELAAIEAAKVAAAKLTAVAGGAAVTIAGGKMAVDKIAENNKKIAKKSKNFSGANAGGNAQKGQIDLQQQKVKEVQREKNLRELLNKARHVENLEKTDPVQAQKEKQEFSRMFASREAEYERSKKSAKDHYIDRYNDQSVGPIEGKHSLSSKEYVAIPGDKGKLPQNGSKAFAESIPVAGTTTRVGIENGNIVQFEQFTGSHTYYGYIVEDVCKLEFGAAHALKEAGLYNGPLPSSGMVINNNPARTVVTPPAPGAQAPIATDPITPAATATIIPAVQTTIKPEAPVATQSSKQQDSAVKSPHAKELVPEIPAIALINSAPTTSYTAGPIFLPAQEIITSQSDTKTDVFGDKFLADADDDLVPNALLKKKFSNNKDSGNGSGENRDNNNNNSGPDKDPDDDWFEKLKKNYEKKGRTIQFGNLFKDPETKLWWSKDNGFNHAGEHYKVFKETAKGLEWIQDVDLLGNIMKKHKGPTGRFIPWKDIIFQS